MKTDPLSRCIAIFGTQSELSRRLGCRRQVVHSWKHHGSIPKWWADALSELTGIDVAELIERWEPETVAKPVKVRRIPDKPLPTPKRGRPPKK